MYSRRILRIGRIGKNDAVRKHNLMQEVMSLQKRLEEKDAEILRLHEVILRLEAGRAKLDLFLQEWVLNNGNPVYPVVGDKK